MKILLAPDSFKGSLTAYEAACAMRQGLITARPALDVASYPMADGGDGTLAVLAPILGGKIRAINIPGMDGSGIKAPVLEFVTQHNNQAAWLIESAQVIGLALASSRSVPALERSSAPLSRLIREGLEAGIRCFYLALGGSATNDGGIGLLSELGVCLKNGEGKLIAPVISSMPVVRQVDVSGLHSLLRECKLHLILDVDNPLLGRDGATYTYGPQKGITPEEVDDVESFMRQWAGYAERAFGCAAKNRPGAGAAGGLGFALLLLGAKAHGGAAFVATLGQLKARMSGCDWVITGEGQSDAQTLHGKVPMIVADLARQAGAKVALISGQIEKGIPFHRMFDAAIQVSPDRMSADRMMVHANKLLVKAVSGFALSRITAQLE